MGCVSSRIIPDEDKQTPIKLREKNPNLITGDITKKNESKLEREKVMKLRQLERITAAEEICIRALDEKDRLSLGTRSRGTSRVSSRAGSPTQTKKVHFKAEEKGDDKKQRTTPDHPSSKSVQYEQSLQNGDVSTNNQSKSKKKKHSKNSVKPIKDENISDQPITNNNSGELTETGLKQLEKLSTIDERASSRNSGLSGKSEEARR